MDRTANQVAQTSAAGAQGVLLPLVLAQFMCSFAATSTNVAISSISNSLGTTVSGIQLAITAFTLTMAALMIPGSKLTDIWGRKFCLRLGLAVYGVGALVAAASQGLGLFITGYSLGEGIGTALLIPPVYIFATILFPDMKARARAFGAISAAGGIGSAAGPLIGGIITTATSWRVTFLVQTLLAVGIICDASGRRPVYGGAEKFQTDPYWRDLILFYEYFHGDNGAGLGASHQTGWTGLVGQLINLFGRLDPQHYLAGGKTSVFRSA